MKRFVGYIANKIVKSMPRSKKVSPTIKSVKPTKDVSGSVERVKRRELSKRIDKVEGSKGKIDTGRKMMREGQKELKRMTETGTAFKFKSGTTRQKTFAVEPGENPKQKYKGLLEESKPQKKFKKGKELREKKMGGGMMGRRFGMKKGSKFPDLTGDGKVTFADILKGRGVINGKKKKKGEIFLTKKKSKNKNV
jgi:hypothetical protein